MEQTLLLTQSNGQLVQGRLCDMAPRHLNDFSQIWKSILLELGAEDAFWDWTRKKRLALSDDRYEAYAVEHENLTQRLLWIETRWHRSQRLARQPLVYVEALAAAPWNRRSINPQPWLQGVGTVLLQFARQRSLELGYQGRVGLHALPDTQPLVVEVVSTNWRDDYRIKLNEYETLGVLEYWIVDYAGLGGVQYIGLPKQPTITINCLIDGEYQAQRYQDQGEATISSPTFPQFELAIAQIFAMTEV